MKVFYNVLVIYETKMWYSVLIMNAMFFLLRFKIMFNIFFHLYNCQISLILENAYYIIVSILCQLPNVNAEVVPL